MISEDYEKTRYQLSCRVSLTQTFCRCPLSTVLLLKLSIIKTPTALTVLCFVRCWNLYVTLQCIEARNVLLQTRCHSCWGAATCLRRVSRHWCYSFWVMPSVKWSHSHRPHHRRAVRKTRTRRKTSQRVKTRTRIKTKTKIKTKQQVR